LSENGEHYGVACGIPTPARPVWPGAPSDETGREGDADEDECETAYLGSGQRLAQNRGPEQEREARKEVVDEHRPGRAVLADQPVHDQLCKPGSDDAEHGDRGQGLPPDRVRQPRERDRKHRPGTAEHRRSGQLEPSDNEAPLDVKA